jgi:hypothetical protein
MNYKKFQKKLASLYVNHIHGSKLGRGEFRYTPTGQFVYYENRQIGDKLYATTENLSEGRGLMTTCCLTRARIMCAIAFLRTKMRIIND